MKKYTLSILIPSRNEEFLARTLQDIIEHKTDDTQIIVGLDGAYADPPITDHPDVFIVYYPESIGQRKMTNQLCRVSQAKYVMKVDAHCAFDDKFDQKMIDMFKITGDNVTAVPIMRNHHAFNWVCPDGHSRYQGPSGVCTVCGKPTKKDVVWIGKQSPQSKSYCFDATPHFQYFGAYCKRPECKGPITETMSLQGSCFMCTREKYWELDLCSEDFPSWGSQGIEVACKTWLSGGRVVVNWNTWYSHMFRTQGGDFGFPYPQSGRNVQQAKSFAKELFFENKWPQQIRPLSWLLEKFWPVVGWSDEDLKKIKKFDHIISTPKIAAVTTSKPKKGIIFYTDNQLNLRVAKAVQDQLRMVSVQKNIPIVSASLKPMSNMGTNIHLDLPWGRLAMWKQILAALEASEAENIFFAEHDVLYHPSHFDFTPTRDDVYFYNCNFWKVRLEDDLAIHYEVPILSGMCCNRELGIREYKERVRVLELEGKWRPSMGYEPGTRGKKRGGFFDNPWKGWMSEFPLVDIKHGHNLTTQRWKPEEYKEAENCRNWQESTADKIEGWPGLVELLGISKK